MASAGPINYCEMLPGINETVGLAVLIVFFSISLAYMLSALFKKTEWGAWAKTEFYQAMITLFILANASLFASISCQASSVLAGGDPFTIADLYLTRLIWNNAIPAMMELFALSVTFNSIASYTLQVAPGAWGWGYSPLAGFKALGNNLGLIEGLLAPFISSLLLQQVLLQVIQAAAFRLLLPVGILFRALPPTRDAGAFLIATAFAFYVVFPLTYVMNAAVVDVIWADVNNNGSPSSMLKLCSTPLDPGTSTWMELFGRFSFISYLNPYRICNVFVNISHVIPQAVFLPALSMVITMTFIKSVSKAIIHSLGG